MKNCCHFFNIYSTITKCVWKCYDSHTEHGYDVEKYTVTKIQNCDRIIMRPNITKRIGLQFNHIYDLC